MTCRALLDQIKDEEKGIKDYFELQTKFPKHELVLESFKKDEQKHKEILQDIMDREGC